MDVNHPHHQAQFHPMIISSFMMLHWPCVPYLYRSTYAVCSFVRFSFFSRWSYLEHLRHLDGKFVCNTYPIRMNVNTNATRQIHMALLLFIIIIQNVQFSWTKKNNKNVHCAFPLDCATTFCFGQFRFKCYWCWCWYWMVVNGGECCLFITTCHCLIDSNEIK